jgi:catechol 2,3-dioxygenase-like lactoylglutathione lyase family enzyme
MTGSKPPMSLVGLDHLVLRAHDAERLVRFYCEVLGCSIDKRQPEIGLVQLRAGAALIDILALASEMGRAKGAGPDPQAGANLDHLCLRVQPFDGAAIRAHLAAHGLVPGEIVERYGAEGTGPSIYLDDPEGNTVELKGPPN